PQTTRKKVLGIYTSDNLQIIFQDTTGILKPRYEMQKSMMRYVDESLEAADLAVFIVDVSDYRGFDSYFIPEVKGRLDMIDRPKIVILNKTDLINDKKDLLPIIDELHKSGYFEEIIPISALKNDNTDRLIDVFRKYMPGSRFFYDPEQLSTSPERFFVAEIIREHVFNMFHDEVPYSTEVQILEFKERPDAKWYISADIIVERSGQKAIIIGKEGSSIKKLGENAREDIEAHLDNQIFLELFVKVRDNWRNHPGMLRSYGY
ncbi:MAG: GTPase Era, partial [Bacteroidota bacterium]